MIRKVFSFIAVSAILFAACNNNKEQSASDIPNADTMQATKDMHTQSNADVVNIKHLDLDISVSFQKKQIAGYATWTISNDKKEKSLKLDTYDLTIDSVWVDGKIAEFKLGAFVEHLGRVLDIPIGAQTQVVRIKYSTGPNATALQWLSPQQTYDKKYPFLYTQSESIYARSWIPCADGPGIRFAYTAKVTVPKGLMALMSAKNPQKKNDNGVYYFEMDIPVPAYLMALAVGDIQFKDIDERTGVYAEPGLLAKARYEFEDVGKMVNTAGKLYGPYRWGRYDVLVLASGFPIGGMENPKLTFCTPTVISGDRSLVNLIAHELAHSWSGNLVTNATWNDFWLNEGFTVYFERRLTEAMTDKSYTDMLWEIGYQDLENAVDDLGKDSKDTHLKLDLTGRDPDDGLTDIAYEKGALMLKLIENNVGRDKMDEFLNKYFEAHAFKTITTEQFIDYLNTNLIKGDSNLAKKLDINAWIYGPGIPENAPRADHERFDKVDKARDSFINGTTAKDLNTSGWTTYEWLHFLRKMPKRLSADKMFELDAQFHFTDSGNSEIAAQWFIMSIAANYKPAYKQMDSFLSSVGRRKFIEPLYEEMMNTGKAAMAKEIYQKYRMNYHPLAQTTLDGLVLSKK